MRGTKSPEKLSAAWVRRHLPVRPSDAHKGSNGHLLIVAGSRGMSGAAILSAMGALRSGAGLVTVALPERERFPLTARVPEALTLPLPEEADGHWPESAVEKLDAYLHERHIRAVAVGPGLSVRPAVRALVRHALRRWTVPLVLDADGLNAIEAEELGDRAALVITPHPGEFARLFKQSVAAVQKNRADAARNAAKRYGGVCVLKGHHSVITDGHLACVNPTGNPAMATGGMGDVLTGVIGALLAQGLGAFDAAAVGTYLHGLSADLRTASDRGLLASEVADGLPQALRKIGIRHVA